MYELLRNNNNMFNIKKLNCTKLLNNITDSISSTNTRETKKNEFKS